jgi:hypothetical protein
MLTLEATTMTAILPDETSLASLLGTSRRR